MKSLTLISMLLCSTGVFSQGISMTENMEYRAGAPLFPHAYSAERSYSDLGKSRAMGLSQGLFINADKYFSGSTDLVIEARPLNSPRYDSQSNRFVDQAGAEVGAEGVLNNPSFGFYSFTQPEDSEYRDLISRLDELNSEERARLEELHEKGVVVPMVVPSGPPQTFTPGQTLVPVNKDCPNKERLPSFCRFEVEPIEACKCEE